MTQNDSKRFEMIKNDSKRSAMIQNDSKSRYKNILEFDLSGLDF